MRFGVEVEGFSNLVSSILITRSFPGYFEYRVSLMRFGVFNPEFGWCWWDWRLSQRNSRRCSPADPTDPDFERDLSISTVVLLLA